MRAEIRVLQCGLGPIGLKIIEYLQRRPSLRLVGAMDIDPRKVGRDAGELAGLPEPLGVKVSADLDAVIRDTRPHIAVVTTASSLHEVKPLIVDLASRGVDVVSTCEELANPWETAPAIAKEIDAAARKADVSVLGCGVNPGFMMDLLPVVMTGVCLEVRQVTVERIQDAAIRRGPFQRKIGAGLTLDEFNRKVAEGTIRHVGLTESMRMIASRLGWPLERATDEISPIVATRRIVTPELTIEAGQAAGVAQRGRGVVGGREAISLIFRASIGEPEPRDRVVIDGTPPIDLTIRGGVNGDVATCAIAVNAIATVAAARPGLRTMVDIEPIACFE